MESIRVDRVKCDVAHIALAALEKLKASQPKHPVFELDDNQKLLKLDADLTQDRFGGGKCSIAILDALNAAFFQEMGFRGNTANYYNPANSFIDKVCNKLVFIHELTHNVVLHDVRFFNKSGLG